MFAFFQKTATAIRALGRMASLQKIMVNEARSGTSSPTRSRTGSASSDVSVSSTHSLPANFTRKKSPRGIQTRVSEPDMSMRRALTNQKSQFTEGDLKTLANKLDHPTPKVVGEESKDVADFRVGDKTEDENANLRSKVHTDRDSSENKNGVSNHCASQDTNRVSPTSRFNTIKEESGTSDNHNTASGATDTKQSRPSFVKKMRNFDVFEGDSARFDVHVTGGPTLDVTWHKEGAVIKDSRKYLIESDDDGGRYSLIIKQCEPDDDSVYQCKVTNSLGCEQCEAELYVEADGEED